MFEKKKLLFLIQGMLSIVVLLLAISCTSNLPDSSSPENIQEVKGWGVLNHLPGQWNGPVISTTDAGSFDHWYVDFRPISPAQVSGISELDPETTNFMSFFVCKHDGEYKIAFRNGGGFRGQSRIAYEVIDEVSETETQAYYRFCDFQAGMQRVYTEMIFKDNTLVMQVFTNQYNTLEESALHMRWEPVLADRSEADKAAEHFNYPQKIMIKDFSQTFDGMLESVYLSEENDPYPESEQPYVGQTKVDYTISESLMVEPDGKIFILITTQSLFDGLQYVEENLKYISRYVYLTEAMPFYTFKNMHPGSYYLYSFYDVDGDGHYLSGDYMSSDINNTFILEERGNIDLSTHIDYIIP